VADRTLRGRHRPRAQAGHSRRSCGWFALRRVLLGDLAGQGGYFG